MLRDRDYGISDVAADALYGQADPEVWDLVSDADACPKPVILGDIPSVEGLEWSVNRTCGLFVGFPPYEHLDKNRGKGISQAAIGMA